jgi:hypothetical protein
MWPKPEGYTLERVDNNGDYAPSNCCWATAKRQARNTRKNHLITIGERTLCVSEWAEERGLSRSTIGCRIDKHGWTEHDAVMTPITT